MLILKISINREFDYVEKSKKMKNVVYFLFIISNKCAKFQKFPTIIPEVTPLAKIRLTRNYARCTMTRNDISSRLTF